MNLLRKSDIREQIRTLRRAITSEYRQKAGQAAAELLVKHPLFLQSQHIACYLATPHEIDTLPFIQAIWQTQKNCYLPVLPLNKQEKELTFVLYCKGENVHFNRYQVLEPENRSHTIRTNQLDLALVPLIAFDQSGNRLGTGGGFYDKTFAFLLKEQPNKPRFIGFAYKMQKTEQIPHESFDVPLHGVVTEDEIIIF